MLIITPAFAISEILILPLPKIIALGGVATGIMNAQEADRVAGIISNNGLVFMANATDARIGRIISVVAVFDVNSVKKVIPEHIMKIIAMGCIPARPLNLLPNSKDSPEY